MVEVTFFTPWMVENSSSRGLETWVSISSGRRALVGGSHDHEGEADVGEQIHGHGVVGEDAQDQEEEDHATHEHGAVDGELGKIQMHFLSEIKFSTKC